MQGVADSATILGASSRYDLWILDEGSLSHDYHTAKAVRMFRF
jgi:hypothetical protein